MVCLPSLPLRLAAKFPLLEAAEAADDQVDDAAEQAKEEKAEEAKRGAKKAARPAVVPDQGTVVTVTRDVRLLEQECRNSRMDWFVGPRSHLPLLVFPCLPFRLASPRLLPIPSLRSEPPVLIATLTLACVLALNRHPQALQSNHWCTAHRAARADGCRCRH